MPPFQLELNLFIFHVTISILSAFYVISDRLRRRNETWQWSIIRGIVEETGGILFLYLTIWRFIWIVEFWFDFYDNFFNYLLLILFFILSYYIWSNLSKDVLLRFKRFNGLYLIHNFIVKMHSTEKEEDDYFYWNYTILNTVVVCEPSSSPNW